MSAYLSEAHASAFQKLVANSRRTKTAEVEVMIERAARELGFWPAGGHDTQESVEALTLKAIQDRRSQLLADPAESLTQDERLQRTLELTRLGGKEMLIRQARRLPTTEAHSE